MKIDRLTPEAEILTELGRRLARMRKQQFYTQDALAEIAGIGVATLRRIEAGQSSQVETWLKILKALELASAIDSLLPENYASPRAQVLAETAGTRRRTKPRPAKPAAGRPRWGDETG